MITLKQIQDYERFHGPGIYRDGTCHIWNGNGRCQTWKTRPDDFRKPVKYGLYDYSAITPENAHLFHIPSECETLRKRGVTESKRVLKVLTEETTMRDISIMETMTGAAALINWLGDEYTITVSKGNKLVKVPE